MSRGVVLEIRGSVQGVGFRPFVWRVARDLGLRGSVRNVGAGVCVEAFGPPDALSALRDRLRQPPLAGAAVESIGSRSAEGSAPEGFSIAPSREDGDSRIALAPDLPTCGPCLAELFDPGSRRHRYPFVSCAECGPRYTLVRAHPYDRERTSMDRFPLCAACESEYSDPGDRRFHAEATACPDCGPCLSCLDPGGDVVARAEEALAAAVRSLRAGRIVGVHGIGGFHLACDARDERAVSRLRERKRRPGKPLAVMVRTCGEAAKLALVGAEDEALLRSQVRPIVALRRRPDAGLAPSVSPHSPMVGLFLAYSPLHTLLLHDFGGPLVMTSANRSGEPIAYRRSDARDGLAHLADRVLVHDRDIVSACDDPVAVRAGSGPIVIRRARGSVPRPVRLPQPVAAPVLACGGQWSNTVCIAEGDRAWLSAHIGDLGSPEMERRLAATVEHWLGWLGVEPERVAHDLHPGYDSTRYAGTWTSARRVGVQHHHAHMAAVMAEHGLGGPALALSWDGTGYGTDGAAWGSELLWGDRRAVERWATFRPVPLAGGERAIREPWRLALALLDDAFDGDPPLGDLALFRAIDDARIERVRALLANPALSPPAHGAGRYFDALGALLLVRPIATFQGELAQGVDFAAAGRGGLAYAFDVDRSARPWQIDLRPAVRQWTAELRAGAATPAVADRFHATLVAAGERVVREALSQLRHGELARGEKREKRERGGKGEKEATVILCGGCFQNPLLVDGLERRLGALAGVGRVVRPRSVPPGDGGLALGQAWVAAHPGDA